MPPTLRRRPEAKSVIGSTAFKPECCSTIAFVRALCKEERPRETRRQNPKERKDWGVVVKILVANSHSTNVGSRNTGTRKPSLHFCEHPHPMETIIHISLCNVQVHPQPEQNRTDGGRLHPLTRCKVASTMDAPHSHSSSKDSLTIPNDTNLQMKRLYTLARLRAGFDMNSCMTLRGHGLTKLLTAQKDLLL